MFLACCSETFSYILHVLLWTAAFPLVVNALILDLIGCWLAYLVFDWLVTH